LLGRRGVAVVQAEDPYTILMRRVARARLPTAPEGSDDDECADDPPADGE